MFLGCKIKELILQSSLGQTSYWIQHKYFLLSYFVPLYITNKKPKQAKTNQPINQKPESQIKTWKCHLSLEIFRISPYILLFTLIVLAKS